MPQTEARTLGPVGATLIGVGAIVGGGILALAGHAFAAAGPSAILVFALDGALALLTALAFAELATRFPISGGAYAFARRIVGVQAAFGAGWLLWFAYLVAGVLYAIGFGVFAGELIGALGRAAGFELSGLDSLRAMRTLAIAAIGAYTLQLGRSGAGGGQGATVGKLAVFAVLIVLGVAHLPAVGPAGVSASLTPFFAGGAGAVFGAMGLTFIALQGFDAIATVAGKVRDPSRTLPRALAGSLAIGLVVYLPLLLVSATAVGDVQAVAAAAPETFLADAARRFAGAPGWWLVVIAAVLSMLSALQANVLAASQVAEAMARDRTLPAALAARDPRRGTPIAAVQTSALAMAVIVLLVPDLQTAGAAASLIFLLTFAVVHGLAWLARRRLRPQAGVFVTPGFPWPFLVGGGACAGLAIWQLLTDPQAATIAGLWLALGALLYRSVLSGRAEVADAFAEAHDPELAQARGRSSLVLVPVANPERAAGLLEVAAAIAPPRVGRVLLLHVVSDPSLAAIDRGQDALAQALRRALDGPRPPQALLTFGKPAPAEILRTFEQHGCQSLVLGLPNLGDGHPSALERLIGDVHGDVVVLRADSDFRLGAARRVLVPVGGRATHEELRARLLGALDRTGDREITFLRILPQDAPADADDEARRYLRKLTEDEAPGEARIEVLRADDVVQALARRSADADLLVLGMIRRGRRGRSFGGLSLAVAQATAVPAVFLGRG